MKLTEVKEKIKELEKKFDKMEEKYNIKALTNTINMLIDNSPKLKEVEQKLENCITAPELEGNLEAFTEKVKEKIKELEQKLYDHDQNLTYNFQYSRENKERLEAVLKEHKLEHKWIKSLKHHNKGNYARLYSKGHWEGILKFWKQKKQLAPKGEEGEPSDNRHWTKILAEGITTKFMKEEQELLPISKAILDTGNHPKEEQEAKYMCVKCGTNIEKLSKEYPDGTKIICPKCGSYYMDWGLDGRIFHPHEQEAKCNTLFKKLYEIPRYVIDCQGNPEKVVYGAYMLFKDVKKFFNLFREKECDKQIPIAKCKIMGIECLFPKIDCSECIVNKEYHIGSCPETQKLIEKYKKDRETTASRTNKDNNKKGSEKPE